MPHTKPLLIILTGHAPDPIRSRLGDFDHWFRLAMRVPTSDVRVVDVTTGATPLPMDTVRGAVISGSAAMVTEALDWSERLAAWIREAVAAALPLFGVCYGHQLMAHALGGRVGTLPAGRAMGTQTVELLTTAADDPLLAGLPARFAAQVTHQQAVLEPPAGATVLGRTGDDPHHILRYAPHAFSTQLHPEFSVRAMRAYIRLRARALRAEDRDVPAMVAGVHAAPHARRLLRRFAHPAATDAESAA